METKTNGDIGPECWDVTTNHLYTMGSQKSGIKKCHFLGAHFCGSSSLHIRKGTFGRNSNHDSTGSMNGQWKFS